MTSQIVPTPDLTPITTAIIDSGGTRWTINGYGQVCINGVADTTTANVITIVLINGNLWQQAYDTTGTWAVSPMWWYKTTAPTGTEWLPVGGQTFSPIPALPAQVTEVTAG